MLRGNLASFIHSNLLVLQCRKTGAGDQKSSGQAHVAKLVEDTSLGFLSAASLNTPWLELAWGAEWPVISLTQSARSSQIQPSPNYPLPPQTPISY